VADGPRRLAQQVERGGPGGHGDCDLPFEKINKEVDITGLRWTLHRMSGATSEQLAR